MSCIDGLASPGDVERVLRGLVERYGRRYSFTVRVLGRGLVDPRRLYSTEPFLESEKLGLVLYSVLFRGYDVPVIVIRTNEKLYVYDGHHRARVRYWMREHLEAYIVYIPGYRPVVETHIGRVPLVNRCRFVEEPLRSLRHAVNIIWFLEKTHRVPARVWRQRVPVDELIATQPRIPPRPRCATEPPPLLYMYNGCYYVVDGHHRICCAASMGAETVDAIVFTLGVKAGIVYTAETLGEKKLVELCPTH